MNHCNYPLLCLLQEKQENMGAVEKGNGKEHLDNCFSQHQLKVTFLYVYTKD